MNLYLNKKEKWSQLTVNEIKIVSSLFLQNNTESAFLVKAFMLLYHFRFLNRDVEIENSVDWFWMKQKGKRKPFLVSVEQITAAAQSLKFLKDDISEMKAVKFIGFKSPHPRLYNLNVEQYINSENFWIAYVKTQKIEYLHKLSATLYVPFFRKFESKMIRKNSKRFALLSKVELNAVYLFYTGARVYLKKRFPNIFKEVQSTDSESSNPKHLTAIVRALNGGDVTKNKIIYNTPLYEALEQLDDMSEVAKKI